MKIVSEENNCLILSDNDKNFIGLKTGLTVKGTTRSQFSELRKDRGYILKDTGLESFTLPDLEEIDGKVVIYSKELSWGVKPLFNKKKDISTLIDITRFLIILKNSGVEINNYSANLFYRNDENELFILPPQIIGFLNERSALSAKEDSVSRYNHPDLSDNESILYSLGILLYLNTTGSYPIDYTSVEDLRDKMRRERVIDAQWRDIRISNRVNRLIQNLLFQPSATNLDYCLEELETIEKEGIYRKIEDAEKKQTGLNKKIESFIKMDNKRTFLIKNKMRIIIAGIIFTLFASFFGTIIYNSLQPPSTTGYTQQEVMDAYFESFKSVDTILIDEVLGDDVRDSDEREISNMHVTIAVAGGMFVEDAFKTPSQWEMLSDEEKSKNQVYGIVVNELVRVDDNSFKASYEKWYSNPADNDTIDDFKLNTFKMVRDEIFTLGETKYSYEIISIETTKEEIIQLW